MLIIIDVCVYVHMLIIVDVYVYVHTCVCLLLTHNEILLPDVHLLVVVGCLQETIEGVTDCLPPSLTLLHLPYQP